MTHRRTHALLAALLVGSLATPAVLPVTARAEESSTEIQAELDQVEARLNELYGAAEQANNDLVTVTSQLNETKSQISDLEGQIAEQQEQLDEAQTELAGVVSQQYKGGSAGLLTMLLNSEDFNALLTNIHYASLIADEERAVIERVQTLTASLEEDKAALEDKQAEQEQLVSDQQARLDEVNAAAADAQAYYDQLSDEMQQRLAEEEAARRAAAEEASRQQAQQAAEEHASGGQTGQGSSSGGGTSSGGGSSSSGGNVSSTPTGSASAMVARAQSIIGSGYRWSGYVWTGSTATSSFTCSGVVDYALGLPTNSNSPGTLYSKVVARGTYTTNASALKYGDLVFYHNGVGIYHVGIYIGGGQVIDAISNGGVQVRNMYYVNGFMGGGSIV